MQEIRFPTEKERAFIELYNSGYGCLTDCYIAVYSSKGSRRTAMAHASRVRNRPAVYLYLGFLRDQEFRSKMWNEETTYPDWLLEHDYRLITPRGMIAPRLGQGS